MNVFKSYWITFTNQKKVTYKLLTNEYIPCLSFTSSFLFFYEIYLLSRNKLNNSRLTTILSGSFVPESSRLCSLRVLTMSWPLSWKLSRTRRRTSGSSWATSTRPGPGRLDENRLSIVFCSRCKLYNLLKVYLNQTEIDFLLANSINDNAHRRGLLNGLILSRLGSKVFLLCW